MSGGFGLPVLNIQSALGDIGDAYDKGQKRAALAKLGAQIKSGDYSGAAAAALDAGELGSGVALLKLGAERTKDARQQSNAAALFGGGGLSGLYGNDAGDLAPLGSAGNPRPDASPASRALPSFSDASGPSGSYVDNLFRRESGGNPNAQASTSSARGLGQFTTGTWNELALRNPDLGLTAVRNGQDGRTDPDQMLRATNALTAQNEAMLQRSNLPVNDATRYSLHFLGAGGGRRFVAGTMANPDRPAASLVSPEQVAANRNVFFDRSGRPKTAGEVMGDFQRSFGGGRSAAAQVAYADDEAQTQALERQMGMMPRSQLASADPQADLPAPGAVPASLPPASGPSFGAPPGISESGRLAPKPPSDLGGSGALPASAQEAAPPDVPTLGGSAPANRVMTMPGADQAPVQVAENRAGSPPTATDAEGAAFQRRLGGMPASQRVQILLRASALDLPENQQGLVKTLLGDALQEARMPDGVKEFLWARGNGATRARSPAEYAAEKAGPKVMSAGSSMFGPDGRLIATAPGGRVERDEGDKIREQVQARREMASSLGLEEGSPSWRSYVATGKVGADRDMSPTEKKMVEAADQKSIASQTIIGQLEQAKTLSSQAYAGPLASTRGQFMGAFGGEAGQATTELDNVVTGSALAQLKTIFGGNPTEGERKILLEIQGSSNLLHALRVKIYDRAIDLARLKMAQSQAEADSIREGRYFKQGGGAAVRDAAPSSSGAPALPRPSPSNRPGAASPADRFGQLVGSGLTRQQAYERLHQEGY